MGTSPSRAGSGLGYDDVIGLDPAFARKFFTDTDHRRQQTEFGEPLYVERAVVWAAMVLAPVSLLLNVVAAVLAFGWFAVIPIAVALPFYAYYSGRASMGRQRVAPVVVLAALGSIAAVTANSLGAETQLWIGTLALPYLFARLTYSSATFLLRALTIRNGNVYEWLQRHDQVWIPDASATGAHQQQRQSPAEPQTGHSNVNALVSGIEFSRLGLDPDRWSLSSGEVESLVSDPQAPDGGELDAETVRSIKNAARSSWAFADSLRNQWLSPSAVDDSVQSTTDSVTEAEAAHARVTSLWQVIQDDWEPMQRTLKETVEPGFVSIDGRVASFHMYLAVLACDQLDLRMLCEPPRAQRMSGYMNDALSTTYDSDAAVTEVKQYVETFEATKHDHRSPLHGLVERLLRLWAGTLDAPTPAPSYVLNLAVTAYVVEYGGFWRRMFSDVRVTET